MHDPPCKDNQGLGSTLSTLLPILELAMRYNLTLVCQPDDFHTGGHATGNMGYLFGCGTDGTAIGHMAAQADVQALGLEVVKARMRGYGSPHVSLAIAPRATPAVYAVANARCPSQVTWGRSYLWLRSQYHLVRESDSARRNPQCGNTGGRKYSVVVTIRRGDGLDKGFRARTYADVLHDLFACDLPDVPCIPEAEAHILVLAEAAAGSEEMRVFEEFGAAQVTYWLGDMTRRLLPPSDRERQRLVRDLDCLALSDVSVLSMGFFSSLAAALQPRGTSLVLLDKRGRYNHGAPPNVKVIGSDKYDLRTLAQLTWHRAYHPTGPLW